eukprot:3936335-Rhodomonas_salina.4
MRTSWSRAWTRSGQCWVSRPTIEAAAAVEGPKEASVRQLEESLWSSEEKKGVRLWRVDHSSRRVELCIASWHSE